MGNHLLLTGSADFLGFPLDPLQGGGRFGSGITTEITATTTTVGASVSGAGGGGSSAAVGGNEVKQGCACFFPMNGGGCIFCGAPRPDGQRQQQEQHERQRSASLGGVTTPTAALPRLSAPSYTGDDNGQKGQHHALQLGGESALESTEVDDDDAEESRIQSGRSESYVDALEGGAVVIRVEPPEPQERLADTRSQSDPPPPPEPDVVLVPTINAAVLEPLGVLPGSVGFTDRDVPLGERFQGESLKLLNSAFDGQTALLLLERFTRYDALDLVFLGRLKDWRDAVRMANWRGLVLCCTELERALELEGDGGAGAGLGYAYPDRRIALKAVETDVLAPDADELELAPFVDLSSLPPAIRRAMALGQKERLLGLLRQWHVDKNLVDLLAKVLPENNFDSVVDTAGHNSSPLELTSVNADALPMYSPSSLGTLPPGYGRGAGTHRAVVVDLTDDARGNVVEVDTESGGFAKAVGAFVAVADRLELSLVEGSPASPCTAVTIGKGQLKAGKGPVSVSIVTVAMRGPEPPTGDSSGPAPGGREEDPLVDDLKLKVSFQSPFGSKSKSLPLKRALASIKTIDWGESDRDHPVQH